jgi:Ion channel
VWALKAAGGVLILAFAFREIFQDLFHPTRTGSLSDFVGRTLFRLLRRRPSTLSLAGPLSLIVVILSWAFAQAVGFALLYWIGFPGQFQTLSGTGPATGNGFWLMLYFSLQVMTTLGFGDLLPTAGWLRGLATFQALSGLALVTASVSWIVLLYPALARMRTLARRASILARAQEQTRVDVVSGDAQYLLGDLALDVIRTRVDLIYFPIIYYFRSESGRASLPESLPYLVAFANGACKNEAPDRVRLAGATLHAALDDLAATLSERFLHKGTANTEGVFRAYAEDHLTRTARP